MRVYPWIVSVLSVMALSAGQSGFAQYEGMGGMPNPGEAGGPYYPAGPLPPGGLGFPGDPNFVPPPPLAPAGAWDPIAAGQNGGPGYDPNRAPWPNISPFENRFAETSHEEELWYHRVNNSARRYFVDLDYRFANYRRPDQTRVGNEIAPQRFTPGQAPFLPVDTGVFYDSFLGNFNGVAFPGGTGQQQNVRATVNNIAVGDQGLESEPTVNGFNLTWGFREPSDQGLQVNAWYTPEAHWAYSRGFNATRQEILNRTNFFTGRPLVIGHALPLNDGIPDGINGRVDGTYVVYDRFFGLDYETRGGGGEVNWNFTPFWRNDWYHFAPTLGVQFLYIGENFALNAADSGGSLLFQLPPGLEIPATYTQVVLPFESQIQSEVRSYLMGPQIGLQFDVGGENLKIRGHSRVGLAVNHEEMELSSFGVGDGFGPFFDQTSRFNEEQEHTRLSPTTTQELLAEANIFHYIPVVNRFHFLDEAKFRIGYQLNAAFEIHRPHRIVEYNGFPLIPAIRTDQESRWYVESWNFGVHWNY